MRCWRWNRSSARYRRPEPKSRPTSPHIQRYLARPLRTTACESLCTFSLLHGELAAPCEKDGLTWELRCTHHARVRIRLSNAVLVRGKRMSIRLHYSTGAGSGPFPENWWNPEVPTVQSVG